MNANDRNFDITGFEAGKLWDRILRDGGDPVAVARASYRAGGPARHRLNATYVLLFEARHSAEARAFAAELLDDRAQRVVEAAARALAWGQDRTRLPVMQAAADRRRGQRNTKPLEDIEAAIRAVEAGNPDLFLDRRGSGCLHLSVIDKRWHAKKPSQV